MSGRNHAFLARVYYADTDAYGVVYYANYLRFIEAARVEWLREQGLSTQILQEREMDLPVRRLAAEFLVSAKLDDLLQIRSELVEVKGASFWLQQEVYRQADNVLLFRAQIQLVSVDSHGKPIRLPQEFKTLLTA